MLNAGDEDFGIIVLVVARVITCKCELPDELSDGGTAGGAISVVGFTCAWRL